MGRKTDQEMTEPALLTAIYYAAHNVSKELTECMPEIEMHEARDFPYAGLRSEWMDLKKLLNVYDDLKKRV